MTHKELKEWFTQRFPHLELRYIGRRHGKVEFNIKNGPVFGDIDIRNPADSSRLRAFQKEESDLVNTFNEAALEDLVFGIDYYIDWAGRYG